MILVTMQMEAQILGGLLNDDLYKTRIKLVDEFFLRFNGDELRPDIKATDKDAKLKNLIVLFDGKLLKSFEDSAFVEAKTFAQRILDDSIRINYRDTTWFAKAACKGTFKGKSIDFTLYLNVEKRQEDMYKWVIAKAEGDIFSLTPSLSKESIMLMPDDHETNFMSLHRITTEKDDYILNYKQRDYMPDETTVFYTLVYNGLLDIDYVKELKFVFLQVPGYVFSVSHFDRDNYNAGWLIDSLSRATDKEKREIIDYIYKK